MVGVLTRQRSFKQRYGVPSHRVLGMYPGKMLGWRFAKPASGERPTATFRVVLRTCHLLGAHSQVPVTAVTAVTATVVTAMAAVVHYKGYL